MRVVRNEVVIGLQYGDEGKGLTTDYLCANRLQSIVVRFSGGQQAGHTVVIGDKRHVFSNFGSGTLRGTPTYWSQYCTFDPLGAVNEWEDLREMGITPTLYVDHKCPVTTPYDVYHNRKHSQAMGHGTCGVGVGSTLAREEDHYSLTYLDLFHPWVFENKLAKIKQYYATKYSDESFTKISLDRFMQCVGKITKIEVPIIPTDRFPISDNIYFAIYEGSQGLMLDPGIGVFPHVTRTNVGTKNLASMCLTDPDFYLVTRAYSTRHGNGPLPNSSLPHNIKEDPNETNVFNEYQGSFRRAILEVDNLRYAICKDDMIRESKNKTLVVTCLDHVQDEYRFTDKGKIRCFSDERQFLFHLSRELGIKKLLVSRSPQSSNMEEIFF